MNLIQKQLALLFGKFSLPFSFVIQCGIFEIARFYRSTYVVRSLQFRL